MSLQPGTRLGPYEIVSRLGAGGMSEVYRAHDPRIRRDVAIKVLPPTFAKFADRMHRFEQEARAAGALNHPNLLTIFEAGSSDGKPYIVTELLEGQTLRSCMRDNGMPVKLPIRKAVDYAVQIANGLAAAHERGIVHRDLKPENLFVTRDGRVKILDFGVAKLRSADEHALADDDTMEQDTSPGTVIGTVGYMSPEQVRGQSVDGRSDIFSLGTVMYEMVAGAHPFRSNSFADTMSAILREDPPELATANPNVTPGLERVVRHCLEKSPEQRFQSARDLAFHLDMLSSGSGTMPTVETPVLTRRSATAIVASIALLLVGLLTGWFLGRRSSEAHAVRTTFAQLTYDDSIEVAPSIAPDGQTFVFTRGSGAASDIYLQRVNGRNAINLTKRCRAGDGQPAFSPDGSQIAYRSECDGGGLFVMGATGESARRVAAECFNPSWSADGTQLVCATESIGFTPTSRGSISSLWIVDVQSGTRRKLLDHDGVQPSWSPHGNRIAYWGIVGESAQRDLWTIDPNAKDAAQSIVRVTNDLSVDWNPVWSADGRYLYFGSDRNGAMNLWRVAIDEESGKTRGEPEAVTTPARFSGHFSFSRDGKRMAFASIDQTEAVRAAAFDPVAGAVTSEARQIFGGSFLVFSSQVSPDGKHVAVTNRGGQEDLYVVEIATGEVRQLTNDVAHDRGATWSPDGTAIYFYSQRNSDRYEIWRINADGGDLTRVTPSANGRSFWYPAVAPDGKRISFYNEQNTYVLTDGRIDALPPAPNGARPALTSWSPDGTMLAGELRNEPGVALYSFADRQYRRLTASGARPVWLPGGREILYGESGKLRIVNIDSGAIRDVSSPLAVAAMSLSSDARTLVFSDRRTQSDVWMMNIEQR
ncbi:MAG: serine/threonine-protein kinase [Acidobacteriota bacterium]|nr:serine/threonine-protein kinase [Acidobacteriota bacterium]